MIERNKFAVHSRAHASMTDFGVHRIGEVDRSRTDRQGENITLRREHEYLGGAEVVPQGVQEFVRILGFALPFEQLPEPGEVIRT